MAIAVGGLGISGLAYGVMKFLLFAALALLIILAEALRPKRDQFSHRQ